MIPTLLAMLAIALLAGLVVVYVAYPHRGRDVPSLPWLGDALSSGVRRLPTLANQESQRDARDRELQRR